MSRTRVAILAAIGACVLAFVVGAIGPRRGYGEYGAYRAQVDALLAGRLALTTAPEGITHDLVWTPHGVQQVWGLGVPLWQTPFEAIGRAIGFSPFPDRIAMIAWLALMLFVLARAFRPRDGEPRWYPIGALLVTALLPAFVTMMRGRIAVYEEAAIYAYSDLAAGTPLPGPAVVERERTTIWLPSGMSATLDVYGNLTIDSRN